MKIKSKTISGAKWTTFSTISITLIGLIKLSILTRFLNKADFGLMALVTLILGFTNLFMDMGLSSAILHKQKISEKEYASLYWINIAVSLILFTLITLATPSIVSFYNQSELTSLIPIMTTSILLSAIGTQFKTIEQKQLNFKFIAITDMSGAFIGLLVGVVTAVKGFGVYALVYSALTQYIISNGVYFLKGTSSRRLIFHFKYEETKPFLKIGIYQVGGQIMNYFNRDLDIVIIGKIFSSDILGGYSLAKQLVQRPMHIIKPIITKVASPILATMQNNKQKLKQTFLVFLSITATINFIAYGILVLLAYPTIEVLYGNKFIDIVLLVQILSIYMFLRSVGSPIGSLLIATGRTDKDLFWNSIVLLVTPVAVYFGAQHSIEYVPLSLLITSLILLYPFWRFLVFPVCGATSREYFSSFIPRFRKIYFLLNKL